MTYLIAYCVLYDACLTRGPCCLRSTGARGPATAAGGTRGPAASSASSRTTSRGPTTSESMTWTRLRSSSTRRSTTSSSNYTRPPAPGLLVTFSNMKLLFRILFILSLPLLYQAIASVYGCNHKYLNLTSLLPGTRCLGHTSTPSRETMPRSGSTSPTRARPSCSGSRWSRSWPRGGSGGRRGRPPRGSSRVRHSHIM